VTKAVDPSQFTTNTQPSVKSNRGRIQYDFDAVLGRIQGATYLFVDYLFESTEPVSLNGAIVTWMRAVSEEEAQTREQEWRDPNQSPLYWEYENENPSISWGTWVKSKLREQKYSSIYDTAYNTVYGAQLRLLVDRDNILPIEEIAVVEYVRGGRYYNPDKSDFADLKDPELFRLVKQAEENGLGDIY
jgi:hypothetical protein